MNDRAFAASLHSREREYDMDQALTGAANALLTRYRECKPGGFSETALPQVRFFFTNTVVQRAPLHSPSDCRWFSNVKRRRQQMYRYAASSSLFARRHCPN